MKLELWRWTRHWIAIFFKIYCEVRKSFCSFGWQDIDEDWVSFNPFNISSARMDQWKDCIFEFSDNSGEMKDINTSSPWSTSRPLPRDFFGHYRHHYLFRHGEMENSGHGHSRYCTKTWTLRLKNKVCNNKTDMNCNTFSTANSSMLCHCPIYNGYSEFSRQICTYLLFFDGNKVAADASLSLFFPDVEVISILYDEVSLFNSIISHVLPYYIYRRIDHCLFRSSSKQQKLQKSLHGVGWHRRCYCYVAVMLKNLANNEWLLYLGLILWLCPAGNYIFKVNNRNKVWNNTTRCEYVPLASFWCLYC